jgi:hypothetical protein
MTAMQQAQRFLVQSHISAFLQAANISALLEVGLRKSKLWAKPAKL